MKRSASRVQEKIAAVALRTLLLLPLLFFQLFPGSLPVVAAADETYQVSKVEIRGNFLFAEETLQKAIQEYLGPRKTVRDLESIQNAIFSSYKQAGYTLVSIVIAGPPDNNGLLTVIVKEDILRSVKVTGNKYLKEEHIRQALPALKTGHAINTKALDRQVLVANDNPSRVIRVALQTIDVGVFDAIVTVKEGKFITHSFTLDNTGMGNKGEDNQDPLRLQYRFVHSGLGARRDATGVLIYSRSPRNTVQQYLAYYQQPISTWGNSWYAMAAYSNSKAGLVDTGGGMVNAAGSGRFYGLHYVHPLYRSTGTKFALDFGLEYRNSIDNSTFVIESQEYEYGPDANSLPLSITGIFNWQGTRDSLSATISYVRNIPGGHLNNDEAYIAVNPNAMFASANYQLWRGNLSYIHHFRKGWIFHTRVDWQYTTQPLIPDEQIGLGGVRSIRGFREREALGDKGVMASFELYTPPVTPGLRFVLFYDVGQFWIYVLDENYLFGSPSFSCIGPTTLSSTGVGVRWTINRWLSFNADYAHVIKGYRTARHDSRLHFDLTATF